MLIKGFEKALTGRQVGDCLRVSIPAAEAFGDVDKNLLFKVPSEEIPSHIAPTPGLQLSLSSSEGDMDVIIAHVDKDMVVLDANHPLAGKDLTFDIEVVFVK
jgi:peptidylprolyl isomerase